MESQARNRLRTMLGELLDYMEGAQEVAGGIAHEYPEYKAMARDLEAHGQRESGD